MICGFFITRSAIAPSESGGTAPRLSRSRLLQDFVEKTHLHYLPAPRIPLWLRIDDLVAMQASVFKLSKPTGFFFFFFF